MRRIVQKSWILGAVALFLAPLPSVVCAQDPPRRWERRLEATEAPLTLFHATQVVNLPTAETLMAGEWQFEIAHRFVPPVSDGQKAFWGLDGPAFMRLGLGYAPSDRVVLTLARSNFLDNWDLHGKILLLERGGGFAPVMVALQGGAAWSSDVAERDALDRGNFQYYGQFILNTRLGDRIALGAVPSFLYNVLLDRADPAHDLSLGLYTQLYLTPVLSLMGEWTLAKSQAELEHDPGAVGLELETGGHFFKVFFTNSIRLNPSQYLSGTDFPFQPDEWRMGFSITRLLRF